MKANEQDKRREAAIHFVASHYRSGALDPERAWQRFAKAQHILSATRVWGMRYALLMAAAIALLVGFFGFYRWQQAQPDWVTFTAEVQQVNN